MVDVGLRSAAQTTLEATPLGNINAPGIWVDGNGQSHTSSPHYDQAIADPTRWRKLPARLSDHGQAGRSEPWKRCVARSGPSPSRTKPAERTATVFMQTEGRDLGSAAELGVRSSERPKKTPGCPSRFVGRVERCAPPSAESAVAIALWL